MLKNKSFLCLFICLLLLSSLSGCSRQKPCNHNYTYYTSNIKTADGKEQYLLVCKRCGDKYYKTIEPTVAIPENVSVTTDKIRQISEDNNLNIVIGKPTFGEYGVETIVAGSNGSCFEGIKREIIWHYSDDKQEQVYNSFYILFNTDKESAFIKEILTAAIMYLGDADYDAAQTQMQSLVNTYSTYANSDLLQVGDWVIYFQQKNVVDQAYIHFEHLSEVENATVNPDDYIPINYDMCQSPVMNKGTQFHFIGTVEATSCDPMGYSRRLHVLANDGNTYIVNIDYAYPIVVGVKYEFWVTLIDYDPCLSSRRISVYQNPD